MNAVMAAPPIRLEIMPSQMPRQETLSAVDLTSSMYSHRWWIVIKISKVPTDATKNRRVRYLIAITGPSRNSRIKLKFVGPLTDIYECVGNNG